MYKTEPDEGLSTPPDLGTREDQIRELIQNVVYRPLKLFERKPIYSAIA
jgi:hypothetical protein